MVRQILIEIGKFIRRMDFNALMSLIIGLLGLILPNVPQQNLTAFFQFSSVGELIKYIVAIVATIFGVVIFFQIAGSLLILWGKRIKSTIELVEYIQRDANQPYVSLEVINHEKFDLTKCYGTLVEIENHYTPETRVNILDEVNPNRKLLSWGGGSPSEYVNIPRNHGRKILNIATMTPNGGFVFLFHGWQSKQKPTGKYRVLIEINGDIDDVPIRTIIYRGCFSSENYITPQTPITTYLVGKNEEHLGERTVIYGGEPATKLHFIECDSKNGDDYV